MLPLKALTHGDIANYHNSAISNVFSVIMAVTCSLTATKNVGLRGLIFPNAFYHFYLGSTKRITKSRAIGLHGELCPITFACYLNGPSQNNAF